MLPVCERRARQLALNGVPSGGLLEILKETGIDFVPVPGFNRGDPPTSFKQAGRTRFHVDLLVPSKGNTFPTVAVPELGAHASGMPYLAYLLGESHMGTLLSRHGAVPVRVPDPARFAIHKILVSRLRTNMLVKSQKDIQQACVMLAMLGEHRSGDIELACSNLPRSARPMVRRALPKVRSTLEAHEGALFELEEGIGA
ncbi:GSU2403 family nucleotidyltransferase fold protein [Paraburkholderia heleia]|uniref:GSU2403 family nucleotidyltransferase fold protein n=1 Tax=Paraburkholderia heleia TaxID=634127 RepID=UPI001FDECDFB|nr:GSU2403 family nucleotidyltransferase fold protein [Paraburkholderia heleia]